MHKTGKRVILNRGKGYLHATGPQFRFILFLISLLISYTILLRVFQKLAEIVQLPIFLPVSLITLLIFIGIGGVLYSHTFVGPLNRIRKALELMAQGETDICLRLRESDDPMLKELVEAITLICETDRSSRSLVRDTSQDFFKEVEAFRESVHRGVSEAELQKHFDEMQRKKDLLDKAIKALGK
jgi:nitrogen fixation/metabolism regulation signal transduction histidine kinase